MRILVTTAAAVTLALGLSTAAFAGQGNSAGGPGYNKGNQGCTLSSGDTYKTPGQMFQAIRNGTADTSANAGNNPKDTVNQFPNSFDSVGDLIAKKCGEPS